MVEHTDNWKKAWVSPFWYTPSPLEIHTHVYCISIVFQERVSFNLGLYLPSLLVCHLLHSIWSYLASCLLYILQTIVVLYFSHPKASRTVSPKNPSTVPDRIIFLGFNLILKQWALMGVASLMDSPGYVYITWFILHVDGRHLYIILFKYIIIYIRPYHIYTRIPAFFSIYIYTHGCLR